LVSAPPGLSFQVTPGDPTEMGVAQVTCLVPLFENKNNFAGFKNMVFYRYMWIFNDIYLWFLQVFLDIFRLKWIKMDIHPLTNGIRRY
jgi:hypothetical protein